MANDLSTAFNRQHWANDMQKIYFKENSARNIVNETLANVLVDGTRINRPYSSPLKVQSYTKGTTISTFTDLDGTNEYLDIDTTPLIAFYVDDIDKMENKWDMQKHFAWRAGRRLNNTIDQAILVKYSDAYSYISARDLGGSGTGAIAVDASNVAKIFTVAGRKLDKFNRGIDKRFAFVGPRILEAMKNAAGGRETGFGDKVEINGLVGPRYGFDVFLSNNIYFSCTVVTSGIPTDGQTFIVDGVTFTWEAHGTACSTAGEVDIGVSEDAAYANLVLAINGSTAGTTSTYCDVSQDDRETLELGGLTASYTSHALVITGYGDVVINESNTSNVTSVTTTSYPLLGVKGSIDFVVEKEPHIEFRVCENLLGRKVYAWTRYGLKTFTKEKKGLVYVKVDTSDDV